MVVRQLQMAQTFFVKKVQNPAQKKASFKEILKRGVFFGVRFELFGPKRFEPAVIVVWPWELVRLKDHRLEKVSIFYLVVIRPTENDLEAHEVTVQVFGF